MKVTKTSRKHKHRSPDPVGRAKRRQDRERWGDDGIDLRRFRHATA